MENIRFKCKICNKRIEMKKDVQSPFSDWAYYDGVEWSDSEKHWTRSEQTPVTGEKRTLRVYKPFDEKIGNEFWVFYEPALLRFNGWYCCSEEEIKKSAIVRCKFEKVLAFDEYTAWIVVSVQRVVFLHELYRYYKANMTSTSIDIFDGIQKSEYLTEFENPEWLVTSWSAQGDCGETKWIYTDQTGVRHLVMQSWYAFDESVLYMGNVVEY